MSSAICNARQPNWVLRCELPRGHSGDHQAGRPDGHYNTWGNRRDGARTIQRRSSPQRTPIEPKPKSRKAKRTSWSELEKAYRDGRKDERIEQHLKNHGFVWCEWGVLRRRLGEDVGGCYPTFKTSEEAHSGLDYAHFTKRSRAQGYRPNKGGQNDADFYLLCRSHHKEFDNWRPRFGEAS